MVFYLFLLSVPRTFVHYCSIGIPLDSYYMIFCSKLSDSESLSDKSGLSAVSVGGLIGLFWYELAQTLGDCLRYAICSEPVTTLR